MYVDNYQMFPSHHLSESMVAAILFLVRDPFLSFPTVNPHYEAVQPPY